MAVCASEDTLRMHVICVKCWSILRAKVQWLGETWGSAIMTLCRMGVSAMRGVCVAGAAKMWAPWLWSSPGCSVVDNKAFGVVTRSFSGKCTQDMSWMVTMYPESCGAMLP